MFQPNIHQRFYTAMAFAFVYVLFVNTIGQQSIPFVQEKMEQLFGLPVMSLESGIVVYCLINGLPFIVVIWYYVRRQKTLEHQARLALLDDFAPENLVQWKLHLGRVYEKREAGGQFEVRIIWDQNRRVQTPWKAANPEAFMPFDADQFIALGQKM